MSGKKHGTLLGGTGKKEIGTKRRLTKNGGGMGEHLKVARTRRKLGRYYLLVCTPRGKGIEN